MGKKGFLQCAQCSVEFKKKTTTEQVKGRHFCSPKCSALGPNQSANASGYGDVPPASSFGNAGGTYADPYSSSSSYGSGSEYGNDKGGTNDKRAAKRKRKKTKKGRANVAQNLNSKPVETDPACVKILELLDTSTKILTSPGVELDEAIAECCLSPLLAVDLEGISMSRVGLVTLLQVAVDDDVFLFDVQALSTEELFHREVGDEKTLQSILEDPAVTKLMFDCRVDSDALYHQHGVSLNGVWDVQLADVAARRKKSLQVPLLSGMPKCAARHLGGASGASRSSLEALDADPGDVNKNLNSSSSESEAVTRVTEHLKTKVKQMYAPDKGGDASLWALQPITEDLRRYAALDVWLLLRIHGAMVENDALDDEWKKRVITASKHRESEYRELKNPVLQFRDPERAVAPDL